MMITAFDLRLCCDVMRLARIALASALVLILAAVVPASADDAPKVADTAAESPAKTDVPASADGASKPADSPATAVESPAKKDDVKPNKSFASMTYEERKAMTKEERKAMKEARRAEMMKERENKPSKSIGSMTKEERQAMTKEERFAMKEARRAEKMKEREKFKSMTSEERKAAKEARKAEALARKEQRKAVSSKEAEKMRKAHAIFAAILDPVPPKAVSFPMSEEDQILFAASRDGMLAFAKTKVDEYDLDKEETKSSLRQKVKDNQAKTQKIVLEAVKSGSTLQQARTGIAIAQFQALATQFGAQALVDEYTAKARTRRERIPAAAKEKMAKKAEERHQKELAKVKNFQTDSEREEWVRKQWRDDKVPKMLQ